MDGRGGCCIARYAAGAYDLSKVHRIMLRFRPIAPKPVAGAGGAATASEGSSSDSSDALSRAGRTKRKYVRDNSNNNNSNKRRVRRGRNTASSPEQKKHRVPVVTLPLLPETPDPKNSPARDENINVNKNVPVWLSFENLSPSAKVEPEPEAYWYCGGRVGGTTSYSCVTVECVTDTWVEGEGLGSTDEERRVKLSKDTCPGFISDGYGRVTWTNGAYREMAVGQESEDGVCVFVAMKMKLNAVVPYPSFTCRVRVVQYDACGKERSSLTVPCDVWRMDSGGFAWRLDVQAALSLSLAW